MESILQFLFGGLSIMCVIIGFFFLRFWHTQRDRLFMWFTIAFWCLAAGWGVHVAQVASQESGPAVFVFRLVAFLLIIAAIVDKNRRAR